MSLDKMKLFQSLINGYGKAYPDKTPQQIQIDVTGKWKSIKKSEKLKELVDGLLKEWESLALKRKASLFQFWSNQSSRKTLAKSGSSVEPPPLISVEEIEDETNISSSTPIVDGVQQKSNKRARAQEELNSKITIIESDLCGLLSRKSAGLLSAEQENDLCRKQKELGELKKGLKIKIDAAKRARKHRYETKKKFEKACEEHPTLKESLGVRLSSGRPRIEDEQPLLLSTIINIAVHGSAADGRRQSEVYRSIKTLDQLTDQLNRDGFLISRSGVYLRLIPRRSLSIEGKRHVVTVPVKLTKAQNDKKESHIDGKFCAATIRHLEELASFLGPKEVCFLSQDDKSRVPIGLAAAKAQSPLLMHVEYRISLPDHDWVVAAQHKLIPSVYAGIVIGENGMGNCEAVTYSGPTFIAIRSGKHSSSTAYSHGFDFDTLLQLPEFSSMVKNPDDGSVKPIFIFTVDGGPDENPRYQKVIDVAIHHFNSYNLDAIYIATNAPGRSAFNRVERRMAPLSKELSGVILPHETYGSHLDNKGKTVDPEMEKKNFEAAGKVLSEIWSKVVIDQHPVVATYVDPNGSSLDPQTMVAKDAKWFAEHVRTSLYFTQIVKCTNDDCCSLPRSSLFTILPGRFLPPPFPMCQTSSGLKAPERNDASLCKFVPLFQSLALKVTDILPRSARMFRILPYDFYCPSANASLLEKTCKVCNQYFASSVILKKHMVIHRHSSLNSQIPMKNIRPVRIAARRQRELMAVIAQEEDDDEIVEWFEEQDLELDGLIEPEEDIETVAMPVFSTDSHLQLPWEDIQ